MQKTFPQEYYIELTNGPEFLGRLTVNLNSSGHWVEIDIVTMESRKIHWHVDTLYKIESEREAVELATQKLSDFIRRRI